MTDQPNPDNPLSLEGIALRLHRDGYWQSLFITELQFLTDSEINGLTWADQLRIMLEADPKWHRVIDYGWINPQPQPTKTEESTKDQE